LKLHLVLRGPIVPLTLNLVLLVLNLVPLKFLNNPVLLRNVRSVKERRLELFSVRIKLERFSGKSVKMEVVPIKIFPGLKETFSVLPPKNQTTEIFIVPLLKLVCPISVLLLNGNLRNLLIVR